MSIKDKLLLIYTFMCMIIFLRILILSFQSHQICILSVGLGMAWNRDGLSCNTNPPASLTLLDVYIFKTLALFFEVCMAYMYCIDRSSLRRCLQKSEIYVFIQYLHVIMMEMGAVGPHLCFGDQHNQRNTSL